MDLGDDASTGATDTTRSKKNSNSKGRATEAPGESVAGAKSPRSSTSTTGRFATSGDELPEEVAPIGNTDGSNLADILDPNEMFQIDSTPGDAAEEEALQELRGHGRPTDGKLRGDYFTIEIL
jgi:hypothetical protein